LRQLTDTVLPDSQELADEVAHSVRMMEVVEYGKDRLPAGPAIDESEEVIIVEGRADVLNLLKHGFKNVIAMNGSSVPQTIIDLTRQKTTTAFVDGDRGGDLNIQELLQVADLDFVTKAPDGKEVEELTQKEIHKCLRARMAAEQAKHEFIGKKPMPKPAPSAPVGAPRSAYPQRPMPGARPAPMPISRQPFQRGAAPVSSMPPRPMSRGPTVTDAEKTTFKSMLEDLVGTKGACILDGKLAVLGKVPIPELITTLKSLSSGVYAIVMDGAVDKDVIGAAEMTDAKFIIGSEAKSRGARVIVLTPDMLEK